MTICLCHGGYMRAQYPLLVAKGLQPTLVCIQDAFGVIALIQTDALIPDR